jgi:molybdate/tungstate transport system ATP-binding protein
VIQLSLKKTIGTFKLVAQMSDSGFIFLTGPNGSGKSTFLKLLAGVYRPDEGYVKLNGLDITPLPIRKRGVVLVTPDSFFPHMEVEEHLKYGAKLRSLNLSQYEVVEIKKCLGIDFSGKVGRLSLGQIERVIMGTALLSRPRLLLIDEATANVSGKADFLVCVKRFSSDQGMDLILVSQDPSESIYADKRYVMNNGTLMKIE